MKKEPIDLKTHTGGRGKNKMLDAVMELAENLQAQIEYKKIKAQVDRSYYDELIVQKFTPEQALELVKSTNYNP